METSYIPLHMYGVEYMQQHLTTISDDSYKLFYNTTAEMNQMNISLAIPINNYNTHDINTLQFLFYNTILRKQLQESSQHMYISLAQNSAHFTNFQIKNDFIQLDLKFDFVTVQSFKQVITDLFNIIYQPEFEKLTEQQLGEVILLNNKYNEQYMALKQLFKNIKQNQFTAQQDLQSQSEKLFNVFYKNNIQTSPFVCFITAPDNNYKQVAAQLFNEVSQKFKLKKFSNKEEQVQQQLKLIRGQNDKNGTYAPFIQVFKSEYYQSDKEAISLAQVQIIGVSFVAPENLFALQIMKLLLHFFVHKKLSPLKLALESFVNQNDETIFPEQLFNAVLEYQFLEKNFVFSITIPNVPELYIEILQTVLFNSFQQQFQQVMQKQMSKSFQLATQQFYNQYYMQHDQHFQIIDDILCCCIPENATSQNNIAQNPFTQISVNDVYGPVSHVDLQLLKIMNEQFEQCKLVDFWHHEAQTLEKQKLNQLYEQEYFLGQQKILLKDYFQQEYKNIILQKLQDLPKQYLTQQKQNVITTNIRTDQIKNMQYYVVTDQIKTALPVMICCGTQQRVKMIINNCVRDVYQFIQQGIYQLFYPDNIGILIISNSSFNPLQKILHLLKQQQNVKEQEPMSTNELSDTFGPSLNNGVLKQSYQKIIEYYQRGQQDDTTNALNYSVLQLISVMQQQKEVIQKQNYQLTSQKTQKQISINDIVQQKEYINLDYSQEVKQALQLKNNCKQSFNTWSKCFSLDFPQTLEQQKQLSDSSFTSQLNKQYQQFCNGFKCNKVKLFLRQNGVKQTFNDLLLRIQLNQEQDTQFLQQLYNFNGTQENDISFLILQFSVLNYYHLYNYQSEIYCNFDQYLKQQLYKDINELRQSQLFVGIQVQLQFQLNKILVQEQAQLIQYLLVFYNNVNSNIKLSYSSAQMVLIVSFTVNNSTLQEFNKLINIFITEIVQKQLSVHDICIINQNNNNIQLIYNIISNLKVAMFCGELIDIKIELEQCNSFIILNSEQQAIQQAFYELSNCILLQQVQVLFTKVQKLANKLPLLSNFQQLMQNELFKVENLSKCTNALVLQNYYSSFDQFHIRQKISTLHASRVNSKPYLTIEKKIITSFYNVQLNQFKNLTNLSITFDKAEDYMLIKFNGDINSFLFVVSFLNLQNISNFITPEQLLKIYDICCENNPITIQEFNNWAYEYGIKTNQIELTDIDDSKKIAPRLILDVIQALLKELPLNPEFCNFGVFTSQVENYIQTQSEYMLQQMQQLSQCNTENLKQSKKQSHHQSKQSSTVQNIVQHLKKQESVQLQLLSQTQFYFVEEHLFNINNNFSFLDIDFIGLDDTQSIQITSKYQTIYQEVIKSKIAKLQQKQQDLKLVQSKKQEFKRQLHQQMNNYDDNLDQQCVLSNLQYQLLSQQLQLEIDKKICQQALKQEQNQNIKINKEQHKYQKLQLQQYVPYVQAQLHIEDTSMSSLPLTSIQSINSAQHSTIQTNELEIINYNKQFQLKLFCELNMLFELDKQQFYHSINGFVVQINNQYQKLITKQDKINSFNYLHLVENDAQQQANSVLQVEEHTDEQLLLMLLQKQGKICYIESGLFLLLNLLNYISQILHVDIKHPVNFAGFHTMVSQLQASGTGIPIAIPIIHGATEYSRDALTTNIKLVTNQLFQNIFNKEAKQLLPVAKDFMSCVQSYEMILSLICENVAALTFQLGIQTDNKNDIIENIKKIVNEQMILKYDNE